MYYKIAKNSRWNTDPILKITTGIVFKLKTEKKDYTKVTWYNRNKATWSYFLTSKQDKTDELDFWTGKGNNDSNYIFSKCTKKEAEEMLGYKI